MPPSSVQWALPANRLSRDAAICSPASAKSKIPVIASDGRIARSFIVGILFESGHRADRCRKRRQCSLVVLGEAGTLLAAAEDKYEHH